MFRIHLIAGLLVLGMAAGCKAQPAPQGSPAAVLNRHIEVMVRAKFGVPQDVEMVLGERKPGKMAGFDMLPITLSHGAKKTVIEFMISSDNQTLARMETYDLVKDPVFAIDVAGRPIRGNPSAKVTVVSYDDLECGYCAKMHQTLFPGAVDRYKDKVRFIYKDLPLVEIHPWAMRASVDANCLAAQSGEAYWAYVDYIHAHGQEVNGEDRNAAKSSEALDRIARQQGTLAKVDGGKLEACLAKQDETQVKASSKEAESLGVEGTPALFVDGERIAGALPEPQLWMVIDRALRAAGVEPPAAPPAPAVAGK